MKKKILSGLIIGAFVFGIGAINIQTVNANAKENLVQTFEISEMDTKTPPEPPKGKDGKPLPPPRDKDGNILPPPDRNFDGDKTKRPKPPVDENGNPLPPPVDENGNPLPPPTDENGNPLPPPCRNEK